MDLLGAAALFFIGLLAGLINTLAGGGSLLTLPALMAFGLPAVEANATNRVAVLLQSGAAGLRYRQAGALPAGLGGWLVVPLILGALLGAWLSVDLDEVLFRRIIGGVMVVMLLVILARPKRWIEGRDGPTPAYVAWLTPLVFFGLGVYGGFLQAGIGVFLLAGIVWATDKDLVRSNALKVLLVGAYTVPALLFFTWFGLIAWGPGLVLGLGGVVGALLGAQSSLRFGAPFLRWVLVLVVAVSATKLLGLW